MSAYSNNHILYGNHGLSNKRIQVNDLSFLDSSPQSLQTMPLSRGSGSSVIRTRNEAKSISLTGGVTYTSTTQKEDSVLYMTSEVNRIFSYDNRYLRTVPKSKVTVLDDCQNATGWTATNDGGTVTNDTQDFQWEQGSVKSLVTVATSANDYATYTKTLTTPINLSSFTDRGNFEFWAYIQDVYYVTSLDLRVGNTNKNLLINTNNLPTSNYLYVNCTRADGANASPNRGAVSALATTTSLVQPTVRFQTTGQDLTLSAGTYTFSIYVRPTATGNCTHIRLRHINTVNGTGVSTIFQITAGTAVANGYYRHSYTRTISADTTNRWALDFYADAVGTICNIGSTCEFAEAQAELSATATYYQAQGATILPEYYSASITTNYEGLPLENGWNYLSVPWGNDVQGKIITESGIVDDTAINYLYTQINYSASASNFNFKLGGFFHVQEDFVRNYPCNLDGGVSFEPDWAFQTDNLKNNYSCKLLNYTGYGIATHAIRLFSQSNITTTSATQIVDLKGNLEPALNNTFTLNTTTNLTDLRFANLNTNETIKWTNTWVNGDVVNFNKLTTQVTRNGANQDFVGKLPSAQVGINRLQMSVVTGANILINQETVNNALTIYEDSFSKIAGYQTFLTTSSGTLTSVEVLIQWNTGATIYITADSASEPSTVLYSQVLTGGSSQAWVSVPCNVTVTNATTYGIYIVNSPTSDTTKGVTWLYNSAGGYGSGVGRRKDLNGGAWSTIGDFAFRANIQPNPATDINWTCNYKPLYL